MSRRLAGQVAVVTGVTSGIGRAVAAELLAAGAVVVGCARDAQRLDAVAREMPGLVPVPCDVRERDQRAALVATALDRFGRIDVLVNNAGVGYVGGVVDMTADDVERILQTNATAVIDLTRLVLPGMLERRDGDVLMVSSAAIWAPIPPLTVYAASKSAVDGFLVGLRREVARQGVRVHSVNPGFVSTEFLARALRRHPREDDPRVQTSPGVGPDNVAKVARRQLERGAGRTVGVPRVMGLGRLLTLPGLDHAVDLGVRLAAPRLMRLGREIAHERTD